MKEKTFKELIIEHIEVPESFLETPDGKEYMEHMIKLLQQVREATIKECEQIAFDNLDFHSCNDVRDDLYNMDTDRIKTDEKA